MLKDKADGILSYCTGGCAVTLSVMMDVANFAQALAMILGCVLVIVRLAYDIKTKWMRK